MTIFDYFERIQEITNLLVNSIDKLEKYSTECEYDKLVNAGLMNILYLSELSDYHRELIEELYDYIPAFVHHSIADVEKIENEAMGIHVEQLEDHDFPIYKISLPILLPNKRKSKLDANNAVTSAVNAAVRRYCIENKVQPFFHAMVIFVSYCGSPITMVDNDNKEASVIMNGLVGHFLRDDSPTACDTGYYYKHTDDDPRTEIYIVDSDHDVELLSLVKSLV